MKNRKSLPEANKVIGSKKFQALDCYTQEYILWLYGIDDSSLVTGPVPSGTNDPRFDPEAAAIATGREFLLSF